MTDPQTGLSGRLGPSDAGRSVEDSGRSLSGLPTGAKLFLILSAALLPLAIIAFFASLGTTYTADEIAAAQLRVATAESNRKLANELVGDMTALRTTLNALEADAGDAPSCARAQGVFAQQAASGTMFAVVDQQGRVLCGAHMPTDIAAMPVDPRKSISARVIPGRGITLSIPGSTGRTYGAAFFPVAFLAATAQPTNFVPSHGASLVRGDEELTLADPPAAGPLERRARQRAALGIDGLDLQMSVRHAPITSPVLIAMLLPILMWLAAAVIAWLVVDALLIRPLRRLRRSVAAFTPGERIDTGPFRAMRAQEIRDLGETFRDLSRTVAEHEAGLAEGLVRQTRLTREVHHRVKNNLQVISSLINFHARGAKSREAAEAYSSIQRRVDALAVVHRNHYAEMEENRGLGLRSMIGELASNIRATAPDASAQMGIALDIDPFLVNQDVATAVTFLITEIIELAMALKPAAQLRISVKPSDTDDRALLRVSSPALSDDDVLRRLLAERYGRVIEGLARQLRNKLHHDPLVGAYEIAIAVIGRD